ncbi:MAG: UDP-N-acetylmuramate--L-alanine ligase [Tissierellia bacterium]|nr:UDP-N-acetylmuramate--L-alanine ligase [Tissierellia bacterium]
MFDFNIDAHKYNHVFFIGIGGISMSALAELLLAYDYQVSGSDPKPSPITERLSNHGATIYSNHDPNHLKDVDLVIYTDAISLDNPELKEAIKKKLDIVDRASFLGALMKNYDISIAISGTHGKTSTTSMVTEIIKNAPENPTILLGGQLDDIDGNIKIGDNHLFLTEACEYKANILKYFPTTATILNIDEDHLDYFDNIDHIVSTFRQYMENLGTHDHVILNVDDENVLKLLPIENALAHTFSIEGKADYQAKNLIFSQEGLPQYDLYYQGEKIDTVHLQVLGRHNIYNSLAAIASVHVNGFEFHEIIPEIEKYKGVHRRLEDKGYFKGARIMDDYAHHPTEIRSTIHALKKSCKGKLYCIFQPHTYTRTKILLDSFSKSFNEADITIITDIYAAREKDYGDIHSKTLCNAIKECHGNAYYMKTFDDIALFLKDHLKKDDIAVTMGAGNVYEIGEILLR